jgi:hypothetical protein
MPMPESRIQRSREILAVRFPRPDVPSSIGKLPDRMRSERKFEPTRSTRGEVTPAPTPAERDFEVSVLDVSPTQAAASALARIELEGTSPTQAVASADIGRDFVGAGGRVRNAMSVRSARAAPPGQGKGRFRSGQRDADVIC